MVQISEKGVVTSSSQPTVSWSNCSPSLYLAEEQGQSAAKPEARQTASEWVLSGRHADIVKALVVKSES